MSRDPYIVLGISKTASADEIKSSYRKLAKKYHPDVNQGRKDIEQKFKEVTAAYELLSDAEKRKRYDRGEINADGQERGFGGGGGFGGGRGGGYGRAGADPFGGYANVDDLFAEFMGAGRGAGAGGRSRAPQKGGDVTYALSIPFVESCLGGKRRVNLANGKTIDVTIPPGVVEGYKLRLRGQGDDGLGGAGDAIVEVHIEPHAQFTRKDFDVHVDLPISLPEAVLGGSVTVQTLDGQVAVKVPKGANSDTTLRLKGKGVVKGKGEAGDMFVKLKIMLPAQIDDELHGFIEKWAQKNAYDVRK